MNKVEVKSLLFNEITEAECICTGEQCSCNHEEVIIRNYMKGSITTPMTPNQREWAISQAEWAGEEHFKREELSQMSDKDLAVAVLEAWDMYAQSLK